MSAAGDESTENAAPRNRVAHRFSGGVIERSHHSSPPPPKRWATGDSFFFRFKNARPLTLGWLLVTAFMVCAAWLGRIGENVRLYEFAYCCGFAGYGLLLWCVCGWNETGEGPQACASGSDSPPIALTPDKTTSATTSWSRKSRQTTSWRWWFCGCVVVRLIGLGIEPTDDARRYLWEGKIQAAGFNPYAHAPIDPALEDLRDDNWKKINHPDYPAIYAPVAQMEFLAVAAIHPTAHAVKAVHVLWDILTVLVLGACLQRLGRPPHLAIVYALCPLVLSSVAVEGHLDSMMTLLLALTLWATLCNRLGLAGVALGAAIATKLVPIVLIPWLLLRNIKAAAIAIAVAAALYVPYLGAGWDVFASLSRFSTESDFFSLPATLRIVAYETPAERVAVAATLVVACFALARRKHDFARFAAAAFTVLLMLMPIVHYWYLSWVLVFVAIHVRLRWITTALAMVACFEATYHAETLGPWLMPRWVKYFVWGTFIATGLAEVLMAQRVRARQIAG